jgi:iron complex transport system substrate-binding protein
MKWKIIPVSFTSVISALLISLFGPLPTVIASTSTSPEITARDISLPIIDLGPNKEIPKYKRVVALANGSAEIVAALGYKNILVGRDIASTMPELSHVPIDVSAMQVSAESVLSHHPDLILIDSNTAPASALATFRAAKIPMVIIPSAFTMNDIFAKESKIASTLGVPKAGAALKKQITSLHYPPSNISVVFLYLRGTASIYLIGGKGSGADSILSKLGFIDVGARNLNIPFNALTAEELVKLRPDVILLMSKGMKSVGGIKGLVQIPGIAQTPAGLHRRVVTVDDSLLLSFGPRTVPMMKKLRPLILAVAAQP